MQRRTTGRLSIPEWYQPCAAVAPAVASTGCGGTRGPIPGSLLTLAARASRAASEEGSPEAFHVTGLIDLIWGTSSGISLDRAVTALEAAARLSPRPTDALSDLSAAYLMRFDYRNDVTDLLAGLEAAERVIDSGASSPTLLFTRASILARLELVDEARAAWSQYLGIDTVTGWADEARTQLMALDTLVAGAEARAASGSSQRSREIALDSLLPAWGRAWEARDIAKADSLFAAATAVGDMFVARGADESVKAMVNAIANASTVDRRLLAAAHVRYGVGVQAFARGDFAACSEAAEISQQRRVMTEPLRGWTRVLYVSCVLQQAPPAWAASQFAAQARSVDDHRFPALAARVYWGLAASFNKAGRQVEALGAIRKAQQRYERIGEAENYGATLHVEAFSRSELREGRRALDAVRTAMHHLRDKRASLWLHNDLWVYAAIANDEGFPRAALVFAREGVGIADRRRDPRIMSESRLARARYALAVGHDATVDLDSVARLIEQIPAGAARDWQESDLLTLQFRSSRGRQVDRRAIDSVVSAFERVSTPAKLIPALLLRAERAIQAGHADRAVHDLTAAMRAIDNARLSVADTTLLDRATQSVRESLRQMALLWIRVGDPRAAFGALERARGVSVGTLAAQGPPPSRGSAGTVVVSLALLGDSLVWWTLARGEWTVAARPVRQPEFLARMARLRARVELGLGRQQLVPELTALYDELLRVPLARVPSGANTIVLVGDNALTALPLAAAYDSATSTHLLERFSLRFASSVSNALRAPLQSQRVVEHVLGVGDPAFNEAARPGLTRLVGARGEIDDLRAVYPRVVVLLDTTATVSAVRRSLATTTLFHFAGHARFDTQRPERSELLLASTRTDSIDVLRASDIRTLPIQNVRLVVLSACESAATGVQLHSGGNGLVTAFLNAGARGVVGSMWKIDDRRARVLLSDFHRAYRSSPDAAEALRIAQLALMKSDPQSIGAWSAFKYETP